MHPQLATQESTMAARLLSRSFRSLAPNSFFFNQQPSHVPISASSSSSSSSPNHHQRRFLFPFSSFPSFPDYPNSTLANLFTLKPNNKNNATKAVTLTSIVHELAEAGKTKEALQAYRKFVAADVIPDPHTYYVLIKALAADPNLVGDAKQCVVDMMSKGVRQYHLSESAYLAVYVAFVKQGKPDKAEQFLKEIKAKGLWGSEEKAVREALKAQSEVEVQSVLDIVMDDSLIKINEPVDEYSEEYLKETYEMVHACFLHYRAIVMFDALMEDGLTKEAMEVREYILANGEIPPVVLYTDHIVACTKAGKTEKVMKVYKRMRANGITPNAYTYGVLIQALAKDPNFLGGAKKYLLKMLDKGLRPNFETYSAVIAAFAQAEKFEECLEILKRMQAKGFDLEEEIVKGGKMCEEALERKRK